MNNEGRTPKIQHFTDLDAWKNGHEIVLEVYKITKQFPREELFGLTSQMRRSAGSITSNIAEGFSRQTYKDKVHFYIMAQGSVTELQNDLFIARDVKYISLTEFKDLNDKITTVHKIINGLIKRSKSFVNHNS